jgi:hypothetical protein
MTAEQESSPFTPIEEHAEKIQEIGNSDAPDAHIHRVLLALSNGEEPNKEDVKKICGDN